MRRLYLLAAMFMLCVAANGAQIPVTDEMAYNCAKGIMGDGDYDYYIGETVLPPMDASWEFSGTSQTRCLLVFVDEMPNSGWDHPCKYIYLPETMTSSVRPIRPLLVIDSISPPTDVALRPIASGNRYGAKAQMAPSVQSVQTNETNPAAGHTYAVILNGGKSKMENKKLYWNDCSFIYKTLRYRYGVPKQNMKVIMADGTDSTADMNTGTGTYISSPLDLDGDGEAEIEYAATKSNLQAVLSGLAQKLTDNDHLLLFVTDHGGYDKATKKSYLYLWDNVKLYPDELASYLEPVNAGFISIVLGQCNSGGFVEALKKPNRIVITASKENEYSFASQSVPFNEFLYHWTSALNGYDAEGNVVNSGKQNVSILDAYRYAARSDYYANGGTVYVSETPLVNYYTNSVVANLSLANIPPQVDLYFDYGEEPVVSELVTKEYDPTEADSEYWGTDKDSNRRLYWKAPCIWVRNSDDGMENQTLESIITDNCDYATVHLYARVRNRGVKPYTTRDKKLKAYWTRSAMLITSEDWKGVVNAEKVVGGSFGDMDIENDIESGGSAILHMISFFAHNNLTALKECNGHLCLLTLIGEKDANGNFPVDSDRIAPVWKTDKLAQKNVIIREKLSREDMFLSISNLTSTLRQFELCVMPCDDIGQLLLESDLSIQMSNALLTSWNNGGCVSENVEQDKNEPVLFHLKANNSKLNGIVMAPNVSGTIGLRCNFLADNAITERKEYDVDIALVDDVTGKCYGGETFRIVQEPRQAINPVIGMAVSGGRTVLMANNVSETAIYKWYDTTGTLVGTGETFMVPAGKPVAGYSVKVEAVSDGAISYADLASSGYSSISTVDSRSNSEVIAVTFNTPAAYNAVLRITPTSGNVTTTDFRVDSGATAYDIPASDMPSGIYQVSLIEGGTVTGTVKFTK